MKPKVIVHVHTKDAREGADQANQCRRDLTSISSKLAAMSNMKNYHPDIKKAAREAEGLVDQARNILFDAV